MPSPVPLPPKEESQPMTMPIPRPMSEDAALLHMIERLARDPSVDLDRFERLVEMREKIKAQTARAAYNEALAALQGELDPVIKRGQIKIGAGTKGQPYALLEDVIAELKPKLAKHGFSVQFDTEDIDENWILVTTILNHDHGHCWQTKKKFPIDRTGSKNSTQAHGSTISYSRRYGLMVCFNMATADEDNDAAGSAPEYITAEQVAELDYLLGKLDVSRETFAPVVRVSSIELIPKDQFAYAKKRLTDKLDEIERKAKGRSDAPR